MKCPFCGDNKQTPEKLQRHLKRNECLSQYSCDQCDAKKRTKPLLSSHKLEHKD